MHQVLCLLLWYQRRFLCTSYFLEGVWIQGVRKNDFSWKPPWPREKVPLTQSHRICVCVCVEVAAFSCKTAYCPDFPLSSCRVEKMICLCTSWFYPIFFCHSMISSGVQGSSCCLPLHPTFVFPQMVISFAPLCVS